MTARAAKKQLDVEVRRFIEACRERAGANAEPARRVLAMAPLMHRLVAAGCPFLEPRHLRADAERYARNAVHIAKDGELSLFALVWEPGQWTPVHDHGTWGVVGIVRGLLEERAYIPRTPVGERDEGIVLERGGIVLLGAGSVSTFVPVPDHIHMTGVAEDGDPTVSLHLYGRVMNSFHVYDVAAGTRQLVDVAHHES